VPDTCQTVARVAQEATACPSLDYFTLYAHDVEPSSATPSTSESTPPHLGWCPPRGSEVARDTSFTPTPLWQPWCDEHEAFASDNPQSPHIWHWGTQVEVDCSNGMTVHMRLTRYEGGVNPASARRPWR